VEQLLSEISKNNLAVYGWKEVKAAVTAGAVHQLLLTDEFIQQQRMAGDFMELDQLMKQVDAQQGKIAIFSAGQESGRRLKGLGGIAAILKYKLNW
jgi:protein pelota